MGQRIEVCHTISVTHPQPFLTCGFETGIVALALRPQGVSLLKIEAAAVNGKPVVFRGFRAAWIEGDKRLALIDRFTVL